MHLLMIAIALAATWWIRSKPVNPSGNWQQRWQRTLSSFLLPPLLLAVTAIALLCMGASGTMAGWKTGWLGYFWALIFLTWSAILCLKLAVTGWLSVRQLRAYPQIQLAGGTSSRLLDTPFLFSAYIGFWQPELAVSQGLLQALDAEHLAAVLAHERGHYYYRDTFWFFWLGWARQISAWLPNNETLWQELLLLREMRADRWAVQAVDPLVLAESLLTVASFSLPHSEHFCAAFSAPAPSNRLEQRIDALLSPPEQFPAFSLQAWLWLLLAFFPLAALPFHS